MDLHDDDWIARETAISADASQMFLFKSIEKWMPGAVRRPARPQLARMEAQRVNAADDDSV